MLFGGFMVNRHDTNILKIKLESDLTVNTMQNVQKCQRAQSHPPHWHTSDRDDKTLKSKLKILKEEFADYKNW